jgi:hypothetical protein
MASNYNLNPAYLLPDVQALVKLALLLLNRLSQTSKNIHRSKHTRWQMLPFQFQCWVAVQPAESEFETSTTPSCCSWFCQPIKNAHDRKKKILKLGLALGVHSGNHWGPYSIPHCVPTCQWCDSKWPWIQNPRKPSDNCSRTMFTHVKKRKTYFACMWPGFGWWLPC